MTPRDAASDGTELHDTWDVVNGVRVHGLTSAPDAVTPDVPPDAPPLVFVHGLGVSTRYFAEHRVAASA